MGETNMEGSRRIQLRSARKEDAEQLLGLYLEVAKDPDGLIRQPEEITDEFIQGHVLDESLNHGIIFVAEQEGQIVGEIHAHTPPIIALRHLLTDLTIVVHPRAQGQGVGRKLFEHFFQAIPSGIARVELYTRETNTRNVRFYERLGFVNEGPQRNKICMPNGELQTPLQMAWFNPNFVARPYSKG